MADLFDYLEWRGDIPFSADPFNEADNLLLCELAYISYEGIVPRDPDAVPIQEVCRRYYAKHNREEFIEQRNTTEKASLLLAEAVKSPRFRDTTMSNFLFINDPDRDMQISAVTFNLDDGTTYAAFRGTDGSIVGWKEDFHFTFLNETPGQQRAVQYLNEVRDTGLLRVGGHSKGGNLALYAAAFCQDQDRIIEVYTNDSPGFRDEIIEKEGFQRILPRVTRIIPEHSVFGLLLSHRVEPLIVQSSAAGLRQHDGFTWAIRRNRFERAELSRGSMLVDETLDLWLDKNNDREREFFIDSVFSLFESTGKDKFRDIREEKLKSIESMVSALRAMPKDRQAEAIRILSELKDSGKQVLLEYLNQHGPKKQGPN